MAIDTIFRQGDDALQNHWIINVNPLPGIFDNPEILELRATTFNVPEYSVQEYEVNYKTQVMVKPSGHVNNPKEFTTDIRCDKSWTVYDALRSWVQFIADEDSGAIAEDVSVLTGQSNFRTDITVYPTDSTGVRTGTGWVFNEAYPKQVGAVSFDYSNGDPISVPIAFTFLKRIIPRN